MPQIKKQITESNHAGPNAQQKKRKKHWSNFFITINTNKSFQDSTTPEFKKLDKKFREVFDTLTDEQNLRKIIVFKEAGKTFDDITDDITIDCMPERGPERGFLHLHALICIHHDSLIRLDYDFIKKHVNEGMGLNCYFHCKAFSKADFNIQNYIKKYHA